MNQNFFRFPATLVALVLSFILSVPGVAQATSFAFLRDSVLTRLPPGDMASFKKIVGQTLDNKPDGAIVEWQSPSGHFFARIRPRATYRVSDKTSCRRTQFKIGRTGQIPERFQFDLCHVEGEWQFAQTPAASFSNDDWTELRSLLDEVLKDENYGAPVSWHSARSGNAAVITLVSKYASNGLDCRRVALTIFDAKGNSADGTYGFCRNAEGGWYLKADTPD